MQTALPLVSPDRMTKEIFSEPERQEKKAVVRAAQKILYQRNLGTASDNAPSTSSSSSSADSDNWTPVDHDFDAPYSMTTYQRKCNDDCFYGALLTQHGRTCRSAI